jgi:hypothetical protein
MFIKYITPIIFLSLLNGCSGVFSSPVIASEGQSVIVDRSYPVPPPGTSTTIWEEPMVDVVDVPPGLDPEGHYYRPSHQEVVEIRQGRWQYYEESYKGE